MPARHRTIRLLAAAAAAGITTLIFSGVVSLAGPERDVLIARARTAPAAASAPVQPARVAVQRVASAPPETF